ncbi:MAG TPA: F0F1 ATP synthase subunit delta [Burkholderiaceae bacterium]|nr:F0F1 ATP synthase subunit delta [Burkholderiaceae bacterium]
MAELSTIARPYAEALFGAAKGADLNAVLAEVDALATAAQLPEVAQLAINPQVGDAQLTDVLSAAVKGGLSPIGKQFVATVVANGRVTALPAIARQFRHLKNASEGNADALIESAFALEPAQVQDLVVALEKKFAVKLKPQVSVNPALIGGVRVTVGDQVLDSSVRAQLDQMRVALAA